MVARCIFSYSDSKSCSSFYTCVDPHNIYGATLPVMCKYFATEDANLGQQVGYLYSINTLGAAAGCLFAGIFPDRVFRCFGNSIGSGRD